MSTKKKKESFEKEEYISKKYVFDINIRSFLTIFFFGLIAYFILCFFVYDNISDDALDIFILIGISIIALFAAYVTFKVLKFIYCIGYNIFLFIDKKFSIVEKYPKFFSSHKTRKMQTQDYINSLQKEIEELKHKLDESQNTIEELSQKLNNESEISESESNRKSALIENVKSFFEVNDNDSISLQSDFYIDIDTNEEDYIEKAIKFAVNNGQVSTAMLQRKLKLGYTRTTRIMDKLEEMGIIGASEGAEPRKVLITIEEYDNIAFQNKKEGQKEHIIATSYNESEKTKPDMTYNEVVKLPEYTIIKEYVSKLKIIDLRKFINELSPFDNKKTALVLNALMADGTLTEYTEGHYLYAEYDSILSSVDNMSENGIEFERFTAELLLKNGFTNVKRTQCSGDYGIDVLAEKDGISYAIQCKCYSKPVGNKAVQEAYSGKDFYRCMVAVVFTNNYFTKSAIETAKQNNVLLWDRNKLIEFIKPLQISSHTDKLYKEYSSV